MLLELSRLLVLLLERFLHVLFHIHQLTLVGMSNLIIEFLVDDIAGGVEDVPTLVHKFALDPWGGSCRRFFMMPRIILCADLAVLR